DDQPAVGVTGGSADQGETIHSSVRRQTKSGATTEADFAYSTALRASAPISRRRSSTRASVRPESATSSTTSSRLPWIDSVSSIGASSTGSGSVSWTSV